MVIDLGMGTRNWGVTENEIIWNSSPQCSLPISTKHNDMPFLGLWWWKDGKGDHWGELYWEKIMFLWWIHGWYYIFWQRTFANLAFEVFEIQSATVLCVSNSDFPWHPFFETTIMNCWATSFAFTWLDHKIIIRGLLVETNSAAALNILFFGKENRFGL